MCHHSVKLYPASHLHSQRSRQPPGHTAHCLSGFWRLWHSHRAGVWPWLAVLCLSHSSCLQSGDDNDPPGTAPAPEGTYQSGGPTVLPERLRCPLSVCPALRSSMTDSRELATSDKQPVSKCRRHRAQPRGRHSHSPGVTGAQSWPSAVGEQPEPDRGAGRGDSAQSDHQHRLPGLNDGGREDRCWDLLPQMLGCSGETTAGWELPAALPGGRLRGQAAAWGEEGTAWSLRHSD